jgi:hypothetical protein
MTCRSVSLTMSQRPGLQAMSVSVTCYAGTWHEHSALYIGTNQFTKENKHEITRTWINNKIAILTNFKFLPPLVSDEQKCPACSAHCPPWMSQICIHSATCWYFWLKTEYNEYCSEDSQTALRRYNLSSVHTHVQYIDNAIISLVNTTFRATCIWI